MTWTWATVPYRPGKNDLLEATRRVSAVLASGGVLAIAGEGRIHASEHELLPLEEGPAYFALRSGVPLVPIAISGTSWLRFGRRVRVAVGEPLAAERPTQPGGRRRADRAAAGRPPRPGRRPAGLPRRRARRALADRGLQRLAGGRRGPVRPARLTGLPVWHTRRRPDRTGDDVATTGLSADPKEYRKRLARAERRADRRLGVGADARRRDPARRRPGDRRTSAGRPAGRDRNSNGCSLPAAGRRRSSDATARAG